MIDENAKVNLRELTRRKMKQEKWSQAELAYLLGTTKSVVCDWLHERRDFGQERIERLLQLLEAKFDSPSV